MTTTRKPRLLALSLTHKKISLELREKLAISDDRASGLYAELRALPGMEECVLLRTCNRMEAYCVLSDGSADEAVFEAVARAACVNVDFLRAHAETPSGEAAVDHLFRVAAGLESQMVGEAEILGQVKNAYAEALAGGATGSTLNRVFQKGFQSAGWARTHTGIGRGEVSIGSVAVELAGRIFGDLEKCRILVLGTGEVGEKTVKSFISRGAKDITVASRTFENAHRLAATCGGAAIDLPAALSHTGHYDILVGSSSVTQPLLGRHAVAGALATRHGEPFFLIDLGLPRNFDPELREVDGVFLYNLDDLSAIANENLRARLSEVEKAKAGLSERAHRVWRATGL